jgi:hypothetical protein
MPLDSREFIGMEGSRLPAEHCDDAFKDSLQEWALREPSAAMVFAKQLPPAVRAFAIRAVLEVLGKYPLIALREGQELLREEPEHADDYGTVLIGSLCRAGEFASALELARSPHADSSREEWMTTIVGSWTRSQPDSAPDLATAFLNQGVRGRAFQSLLEGWAVSAPNTLAEFAFQLPAGPERAAAFHLALESWTRKEPLGAAEWIGLRLGKAPEFDAALATLLTHADGVFCPPETAVEWAGAINDPSLRLSALTSVVKTWAANDGPAALRYIQNGAPVDSTEHETLLAAIEARSSVMDE